MTKPLATTTIAAHQPASKTSPRFWGSLCCVIGTQHTTTIAFHQPPSSKTSHVCLFSRMVTSWKLAPPPPPPSSKTSHVCSFLRVVTSWHHYHHHHPWKRAAYARFQGWLLLGSFLLQPITTTTLHPRKQACMLVFDSIIRFCKY